MPCPFNFNPYQKWNSIETFIKTKSEHSNTTNAHENPSCLLFFIYIFLLRVWCLYFFLYSLLLLGRMRTCVRYHFLLFRRNPSTSWNHVFFFSLLFCCCCHSYSYRCVANRCANLDSYSVSFVYARPSRVANKWFYLYNVYIACVGLSRGSKLDSYDFNKRQNTQSSI